MKKLIILSAGHTNKPGRDQGATGNGFIEGWLTVEFRQLLYNELKNRCANVIMDGNNSILAESINFFKKYANNDAILLENHFNSGPPSATGTETLVPGNPEPDETFLAQGISSITANTLDIPMRGKNGVKTELESHHGRLGWMRQSGLTVLSEICFISNADDIKKYQSNKFNLAKNIANFLYEFSIGNTKDLLLNNIPKETVYIVQPGDNLTRIANMHKTTVEEIRRKNNLTSDLIKVFQMLKI